MTNDLPAESHSENAFSSSKSEPKRKRVSPRKLFAGIAVVGAVLLMFTVRSWTGLSYAWSYIISINTVTFFLYGYDKMVAKVGLLRVPELVLHVATFAGGTPSAFVGQNLFKHKTSKSKFRRMFWFIVAGQFAVFGLWIYLTRE